MKYTLVKSADFKPVPIVNVGTHNPRTFSLGTLSDNHCLRLIKKMKTGAPELHNTLHNDPFVKALITIFDADIIIPINEKQT